MHISQNIKILQEWHPHCRYGLNRMPRSVENSVEKVENSIAKGVIFLQVTCKNVENPFHSTDSRVNGNCLIVEKQMPYKKVLDKNYTISRRRFPTCAFERKYDKKCFRQRKKPLNGTYVFIFQCLGTRRGHPENAENHANMP